MTEKEKMLAGQIYDPSDEELLKLRQNAHILSKKYKGSILNILSCEETEEKYGMPVDVFIANAQKL